MDSVIQGKEQSEEEWHEFGQTVPLKRVTTLEDISNAVVYLISDESSFVSGVSCPFY